ncbi:MAG: FecR domain-containing protein [Asticcacaulis sp.]|uniref:FecR family protein n=1 Tax=Asticcacaulis sp. TaxID=1872648 RepID=UPI0039E70189
MDDRAPDYSAEYWAIRLESAPLDIDEQAALAAWLAEDERHEGRLLRAQATLSYLDRARALSGAVSTTANTNMRRRFFTLAAGTLAASLVAGFVAFRPREKQIVTEIGEVRQVPLADGSTATVNTASKVEVRMEKAERVIKLADGEAWFRVAHDKTRPFIVEAGDVRVRAIGTAFSVRRRNNSADVLVTEGVVETWVVGKEDQAIRMAAGSKAFVSRDAGEIAAIPAAHEIDRSLAWRTGELALDGETLEFAVDELNRYNTKKLVIDTPELGREPLVGYFRTNEPANFGHAVSVLIGARVTDDGNEIHLSMPIKDHIESNS